MKFKKAPSPEIARRSEVRLNTKAISDDGQFEGYGSVFGNEDSYGDVVAQGAFAKSLSEHKAAGTMPALLWQHDPSEPIGIYTEMREDKNGLYVKGQLALDVLRGRDAHALLKAGALNGLSIGYRVVEYTWNDDDEIYTLDEIDLWEVSLVTFPANRLARVTGVKAQELISDLGDWKSYEAFLRDEGKFSREAAAAMVAKARKLRDSERDARETAQQIQQSGDRLQNLLKS